MDARDERRRSILEALQQRQYYKDLARRLLRLRGQLTQVTAIIKNIHGIDCNRERFIFIDIKPGRMLDYDDKWKRTDVEWAGQDWSTSYQADPPRTIRHRSYNVENRDQGTSSHPRDKGEQLISHPSREKYGYLPQFYELDSSMPGFFGNSENVEGFLVGGKEKLQEIRRELSCRSRARSSDEISEENMDDMELISCDSPSDERKKVCSLWGVDLHEEDFRDTPEESLWGVDLYEEDSRDTPEENEQHVNRPT